MKNKWFAVLYIPLLVGFTVFVLMDTFVIGRVYQQEVVDSPRPTEPPLLEPVITDNSYDNGQIRITLTQYREHDTSVYVADIRLSSPEQLKTALAQGSYGRNIKQTTSEMARQNGAILAVNGDYYGARDKGYVLRNGTLYRDIASDREALVIGKDGSLRVLKEKQITDEILTEEPWQILSFGPGLLDEGQITVDPHTEVDQATNSNPRTAIACVDQLHYLLVVSDGRTSRSEGLTLYELAEFLQEQGARTAYNLDGGGSSTMWFNGRVVNEPVNHGSKVSERRISDIVYIGA